MDKNSEESVDYRDAMRESFLREQRKKEIALYEHHKKYTCGFAENFNK